MAILQRPLVRVGHTRSKDPRYVPTTLFLRVARPLPTSVPQLA
jgi:hypothetical protein